MTEYTELQIIKHALQYYVERPDSLDKDVEQEKRLLESVENRVECLKERYGIKPKVDMDELPSPPGLIDHKK